MHPAPKADPADYPGGKLSGKIAVITGGDSGIGKAVALLFAKEGADVALIYISEEKDAVETQKQVRAYGRTCQLIQGDLSSERFCEKAIKKIVKNFGRIDILVNNAAVHWEETEFEKISSKHLHRTFEINVYSMFYLTRFALPHMPRGSSVINTSSVTAYRGSAALIDYSSTKGAIISFTRSLSANLIKKNIRVNAVAPGPIWTPLIVSSFDRKKVAKHGSDVPMQRAGEPNEVAPSFLFLASADSSYITGQVLHPNGGEIVNG
jgi:NAD(P)-dependent dehydrogenase (short-subunit alcohol dehydrogenase family)